MWKLELDQINTAALIVIDVIALSVHVHDVQSVHLIIRSFEGTASK
jgi:hypothetical protein